MSPKAQHGGHLPGRVLLDRCLRNDFRGGLWESLLPQSEENRLGFSAPKWVSYEVIVGKESLVKGTRGVGSCGISNPACLCHQMTR